MASSYTNRVIGNAAQANLTPAQAAAKTNWTPDSRATYAAEQAYKDPIRNSVSSAMEYGNAIKEANDTNIKLAREQRDWSASQAKSAMDFEERMSSTAHQREMADLMAAGLNPILTATGGSGASTGSGSMGTYNAATVSPQASESLLQNVSSQAYNAKRFKELEMQQLQLNNRAVSSQADLNKSNEFLNMYQQRAIDANVANLTEQLNTQRAQQGAYSAQAFQALSQGNLANSQSAAVDAQSGRDKMLLPLYQSGGEVLVKLLENLVPEEKKTWLQRLQDSWPDTQITSPTQLPDANGVPPLPPASPQRDNSRSGQKSNQHKRN